MRVSFIIAKRPEIFWGKIGSKPKACAFAPLLDQFAPHQGSLAFIKQLLPLGT